jgi:hypothetical protein
MTSERDRGRGHGLGGPSRVLLSDDRPQGAVHDRRRVVNCRMRLRRTYGEIQPRLKLGILWHQESPGVGWTHNMLMITPFRSGEGND